jgi:ATP diphosphatase
VRAALVSGDIDAVAEEIGDLLFAAVNVSRHAKVDAESALRRGSRKFEQRFSYVESRLHEAGSSLEQATLEQMDQLWDAAKENEKG